MYITSQFDYRHLAGRGCGGEGGGVGDGHWQQYYIPLHELS